MIITHGPRNPEDGGGITPAGATLTGRAKEIYDQSVSLCYANDWQIATFANMQDIIEQQVYAMERMTDLILLHTANIKRLNLTVETLVKSLANAEQRIAMLEETALHK